MKYTLELKHQLLEVGRFRSQSESPFKYQYLGFI